MTTSSIATGVTLRKRAIALGFASMLGASLIAPAALAQDQPQAENVAAARSLGLQGIKMADAGDCKGAIEKLSRAESLYHAPSILARLGECQVQVGQIVLGTENLNRVVREQLAPNAPKAFKDAQERAKTVLNAALPKIARLTVKVEPADAKPQVTVAGAAIPPALIGVERPTDPGTHEVVVSAPGYIEQKTSVTLAEGGTQEIAVNLVKDPNAAAAAAPPPPTTAPVVVAPTGEPPSDKPKKKSNTLAYVALGDAGEGGQDQGEGGSETSGSSGKPGDGGAGNVGQGGEPSVQGGRPSTGGTSAGGEGGDGQGGAGPSNLIPCDSEVCCLTANGTVMGEELLLDGGFELGPVGLGLTPWTQESTSAGFEPIQEANGGWTPRTGTYFAYLSGIPDEVSKMWSEDVIVPEDTGWLELRGYRRFQIDVADELNFDYALINFYGYEVDSYDEYLFDWGDPAISKDGWGATANWTLFSASWDAAPHVGQVRYLAFLGSSDAYPAAGTTIASAYQYEDISLMAYRCVR